MNIFFLFGMFLSSVLSYSFCNGYKTITKLYEDYTKVIEEETEWYIDLYNKQQNELFR